MPEGHSIHRIARQFNDVFTGESVRVSSPQGRYTDGAALLDGASILNAYAHGKHLFVPFNNELTLNVHLGIYGNWSFGGDETFTGASSIGAPRKIGEKEYTAGETEEYTGPPAPKGTTRCRIVSEHGWADLVGPTICRTLNPDEVAQVRAKLGPDPLNTDANPERSSPQKLKAYRRDPHGSGRYLRCGQYFSCRIALPPRNRSSSPR